MQLTDLYRHFQSLPAGAQASMRRAAFPDELREMPGFYRLFPGARPSNRDVRLAYCLPWCEHLQPSASLGPLLVDGISEERIIQIARASHPSDLQLFRRVVMQLKHSIGWMAIASMLWFWGTNVKHSLVENYFIALHQLEKGQE
ncbi:hypothetical protein CCR91_04865 [Thiorhodovibrio winogradskyi]|nr:hypothetical protein [Thiorhodovibrio winogradskyi]